VTSERGEAATVRMNTDGTDHESRNTDHEEESKW